MSLQNILVPNNENLYCNNLSVYGTLSIPGFTGPTGPTGGLSIKNTLTMQNTSTLDFVPGSGITGTANFVSGSRLNFTPGSGITGTANFLSGSLCNFSSGSLVEGNMAIGNSAALTLNSGSSFTSNGTVNLQSGSNVNFAVGSNVVFPEYTITATPQWTDGINDYAVNPTTIILKFKKVGNQTTVYIPGFNYTPSSTAQGYFFIPWTGFPAAILPDRQYMIACPVINSGVTIAGYIYCNTANDQFEIRVCGNDGSGNNKFSGIDDDGQALGASFTLFGAGNIMSFTYANA